MQNFIFIFMYTVEMSQTLLWVYITGENWWSSTPCNWLMRGKIKQHLLDSVSMESKKMHKKKKKAKMQDQLDEHKARLASTQHKKQCI